MFRCLLFIGVFSVSACAQFFGLATPADGSSVYFATPLRQKDSTQPTYGKLFQVDDSGLKLVLARDIVNPPAPGLGGGNPTNAYDLVGADISSDGQVFAVIALPGCIGDPVPCSKKASAATTITANGQPQEYQGMLRLSANGEWAFGVVQLNPFSFGNLVNVATGPQPTTCSIDCSVATSGRPVANDGTAVFFDHDKLMVQRGTDLQGIPAPGGFDAVIDAAARTIVFAAYTSAGSRELRITSPDATSADLLASDGYSPSMTDDGRQVLYLSNRTGTPQAYLINTDGSGDRSLTNDMDGIDRAILSGDGTIAYAVTSGGRLLNISVASAAVQELIPRTPFLSIPSSLFLAPGKLVSLPGAGLSTASYTATPLLPESLGGVQVAIQGKQARIQSVQPTAITLLVPLDVAIISDSTSTIHLEMGSPSPFEILDASAVLVQFAPEVLNGAPGPTGGSYMFAAHEDWSGLVSDENPAHPGEILHTYAVGMGPTTPPVLYGEAAPSQEPLARLATQLECNVEVLFAGLAPALAGIYQIDWRVPTGLPDTTLGTTCQFSGGFAQIYGAVPVGASDGP
jgi:uncharacterized protein (TIGR03437 family)